MSCGFFFYFHFLLTHVEVLTWSTSLCSWAASTKILYEHSGRIAPSSASRGRVDRLNVVGKPASSALHRWRDFRNYRLGGITSLFLKFWISSRDPHSMCCGGAVVWMQWSRYCDVNTASSSNGRPYCSLQHSGLQRCINFEDNIAGMCSFPAGRRFRRKNYPCLSRLHSPSSPSFPTIPEATKL